MILGLTGGIGSGKSTIIKIWKDLVPCIDGDDIVLDIFSNHNHPSYLLIKEAFGNDVLLPNKNICRDKLRDLGHDNKEIKKTIDENMIESIWKVVEEFHAQNHTSQYTIFSSAKLIESSFKVDYSALIYVEKEEQIRRAIARGTHPEIVSKIMSTQIDNEIKKDMVDFIIDNNSHDFNPYPEIWKIHSDILNLTSYKNESKKLTSF